MFCSLLIALTTPPSPMQTYLTCELNGLMVLLGVGVFFAWRWLGGRDLLVFSWVLIAHALFELFTNPSLPGLGRFHGELSR